MDSLAQRGPQQAGAEKAMPSLTSTWMKREGFPREFHPSLCPLQFEVRGRDSARVNCREQPGGERSPAERGSGKESEPRCAKWGAGRRTKQGDLDSQGAAVAVRTFEGNPDAPGGYSLLHFKLWSPWLTHEAAEAWVLRGFTAGRPTPRPRCNNYNGTARREPACACPRGHEPDHWGLQSPLSPHHPGLRQPGCPAPPRRMAQHTTPLTRASANTGTCGHGRPGSLGS